MSHRWLFGFLLGALGACSSPPEIPATGNGELHQGSFVYDGTTALPLGIAVGADFDLRFDPTTPATTALEPSTSFFSVDATGRFHTTRAGYGVVLVTNAKSEVVDFVNLHVKTIASLTIEGVDPATSLTIGETRTLRASAFDAAGEPLAGTLTLEWESSDPAIATVTGTTLRAEAAGTARIRVVAGASTGTIAVQVGGA